MTKCSHMRIQISRVIEIVHWSNISYSKNEDNEIDISKMNWQEASEWDISPDETKHIKVICTDCKRKWSGDVHPVHDNPYFEFPNWLQERLNLEDSYFEKLL